MISDAEVEKLRSIRAARPEVLSLYLRVPLDPPELAELPARAAVLISAAGTAAPQGSERAVVAGRDRDAVLAVVASWGREWLGTTVAIVAGWRGLDACQVPHRITELARHRHHEVAAVLARDVLAGDTRPLVVGGHLAAAPHLLRLLPPSVAALHAGSFAADPHTLTTARARQLAVGIVAEWVARRERQAVAEVTVPGQREGDRAGGRVWRADAVPGLPASLAAVNAGMVRLLLISDDEIVPGFVCSRCGDLSLTGAECPDWGAASQPVPDLLEEMAVRVLEGGGEVMTVHGPPWRAAARLRFPVPPQRAPRATASEHDAVALADPLAPVPR